ncbi:MAG: carboxypeptidase regulatory-like domain-containing protein [Acidobacteria bacterium]|nr:carboxypeptidase regulatory-like domain-containing protein [Acidobacteriota bacterium]
MKLTKIPSVVGGILLGLAILPGTGPLEAAAATHQNKTKAASKAEKQAGLWTETAETAVRTRGARPLSPARYRLFRLNRTLLAGLLAAMPMEFTKAAADQPAIMEIPLPDGKLARFRITESPVLAPQVAAELPGVKTFSGQGIDDPTAVARFDWTPLDGFHGYILSENGTIYIDPFQKNDRDNYLVYYKHEYGDTAAKFRCNLDDYQELNALRDELPQPDAAFSNGGDLRTYRLAIAGTGEYTVNRGGQASALTAVTTAVNRIVGIYRRDAAISFTLVSGTNTLFPDGATDPYVNDGDVPDLSANQTQLDTIIGSANYDLGHLFETSNGGIASTPSVCNASFKAQGLSGLPNPTGDPFVVDYVAHEMGHQFSGQHSYNNSGDGGCTTRSAGSAYEPASGATIMSYVGICNPRNLQSNSYDLFSVQSLNQVISERNNTNPNRGGSCGTLAASGNSAPSFGALTNYTIPKNTPFALSATATDANDPAGQLTYSWEENDLGPATVSTGAVDSDADGNARPIFRILQPTNAASTRNFPSLTYILNNSNVPPATYTGTSPTGNVCLFGNCITGEILPSIARTMSFRVTARDNNATAGGAADATVTVTVSNNGPFRVTAQNSFAPAATWLGNTFQTVTWDVNGSTAEAANVKISLSTDGGNTFPFTLAASTPNDGTQSVAIPNVGTTTARIKVEAVGNIFFDVNDANFTIQVNTAAPVSVTGRVLSPEGRGVAGARVSITDQSGSIRSAATNSFGYFRFEGVEAGQNYTVTVRHKQYRFAAQVISVGDNVEGLELTAQN